MFGCWTEGAAGLRRMPHTQTSGAALVAKASKHLHKGCIRQDSFSLQPGSYPTAALESLPALRFCRLVLSFASPIPKPIERSGLAFRPAQPSFLTPYHQPTHVNKETWQAPSRLASSLSHD